MDETLNAGAADLEVGHRFAQRVDLSESTEGPVDLRFAWAVQIGDHGTQNINIGVGPLVPRPGSPAAQLVDDLTANLRPPMALVGLVARSKRNRWVVLHGSAGSGKSTALAALVRPELTEGRVPKDFVHAVVQLDSTSTAWWLAEQLADQFRLALPRYTPAVEACRAVDPRGLGCQDPLGTTRPRAADPADSRGPGRQRRRSDHSATGRPVTGGTDRDRRLGTGPPRLRGRPAPGRPRPRPRRARPRPRHRGRPHQHHRYRRAAGGRLTASDPQPRTARPGRLPADPAAAASGRRGDSRSSAPAAPARGCSPASSATPSWHRARRCASKSPGT